MTSLGVSIVIPAYNEEDGIVPVLQKLLDVTRAQEAPYEIIVVNDGSTDRTRERLAGISDIRVIDHQANRGYGSALKTGIRNAQYDIIVITDADGTYPNECIPELVGYLTDYDMVVGARVGESVHIPLLRRLPKWVLGKLASYLAQTRIDDINSGLRVMKRPIVRQFMGILPAGFSFTMTITLAMHTNSYNVLYIPITYQVRTGKSKIRPIRDTLRFVNIIVRTVLYFNPMRVFGPIGALFLLLSAGVGVGSIVFGRLLDVTVLILFVTAIQILLTGMVAEIIDKRNRVETSNDR